MASDRRLLGLLVAFGLITFGAAYSAFDELRQSSETAQAQLNVAIRKNRELENRLSDIESRIDDAEWAISDFDARVDDACYYSGC